MPWIIFGSEFLLDPIQNMAHLLYQFLYFLVQYKMITHGERREVLLLGRKTQGLSP